MKMLLPLVCILLLLHTSAGSSPSACVSFTNGGSCTTCLGNMYTQPTSGCCTCYSTYINECRAGDGTTLCEETSISSVCSSVCSTPPPPGPNGNDNADSNADVTYDGYNFGTYSTSCGTDANKKDACTKCNSESDSGSSDKLSKNCCKCYGYDSKCYSKKSQVCKWLGKKYGCHPVQCEIGAIVGGVIGGFFGLLLIIGVVVGIIVYRKRHAVGTAIPK